jgi:hypothetical protein
MGKKKKLSLKDRVKAGLDKAGVEASKAAKVGLGAVKDGSGKVAAGATKAAKIVATNAVKAKDYLDDKSRAALDKAYNSKKPLAVKNLQRIKKANPKATPSDVLNTLESNLKVAEEKTGSDSDAFTDAVTLYVFTAVEVYGTKVADKKKKQVLIDTIVVIDSEVAKAIAQFGGAALTLVAGRLGAIGKAVGAVAKASNKLSWLKPLIALAGIKNPAKKSTTWIVTHSTRSILGAPPKAWPKSELARKS